MSLTNTALRISQKIAKQKSSVQNTYSDNGTIVSNALNSSDTKLDRRVGFHATCITLKRCKLKPHAPLIIIQIVYQENKNKKPVCTSCSKQKFNTSWILIPLKLCQKSRNLVFESRVHKFIWGCPEFYWESTRIGHLVHIWRVCHRAQMCMECLNTRKKMWIPSLWITLLKMNFKVQVW